MKILAVDSSAKTAAVAILSGGALLASYTEETGTHSTTLLPMIESMLSLAGLTYDDIDVYAAVVGPGSFTGVRIGVSAVKGLAFMKNVPCVGVSSLDAMAENLRGVDGLIVPVIDARRDTVFTAIYRSSVDGTLEKLADDAQMSTDELCALLAQYGGETVYFTGDAYGRMVTHENRPSGTAVTPENLRIPSGYGVARAALEKWNATDDKSGFTDAALLPVYLKKSQAERERDERIASENGQQ